MKKTILTSALLAMAGVGLMAGSAMALPTLDSGYAWNSNDYWTLTDFTTTANGNSNFQLQFEGANYESSFGLYTKNGSNVNRFQVWDKNAEPSFGSQTVTFKNDGAGNYSVSLDDTTFTAFDDVFGFYFEVFTNVNGTVDNTSEYLWYTDKSLNSLSNGTSQDATHEHVLTAWNASSKETKIYLDDQLNPGDQDFDDMIAAGNDLQPVPEPATMLLFGTGLASLAGIIRRRNK